jgi:SNF2 family DNA or RNA helicase
MHRRAFCFNDPGTGKTMSALWAADYLIEKGYVRRVLVLCPLSIMQSAWMQDLNNAIMHRSAIVAHHTQSSRRIEMIQQDYTFVISNYDGLALVAQEIINDGRFDLIIVDESSNYKNPSTNRWKALASIIKPETYLWMMTGTPASQSPVDAYGLAKLVNPGGVPKYLSAWRDMTMHKITQFKWAPKPNAAELVFEALQPAIRFTKGQCLDLPPVITVTRDVPMTPQQSKYYRLLKEQMMVKAAGETISAVNAGVAVSKLLQISCGAAYTDDKEVVEFDASPRLAVLEEVLQETKRKVLIFAMFRSSIDAVASYLNKKGYPTEQIQGDVSPAKRNRIIHDFQTTDNLRVLVLQPAAAAHGLTLTAADTVIFYGPLMSVEMYTQCIARADRKGQDSDKVTVVHLQSSHIEREMFKAMNSKVSEHALLVNLFNEEIKS